jgi:hypothetical protein
VIHIYWNKLIRETCKIGRREQTCVYLGIEGSGLVCLKFYSSNTMKIGTGHIMVPIGGNCNGENNFEMNKEDI